ncbi:MAG: NnrS family protein [Pseudomonadota bacterium]
MSTSTAATLRAYRGPALFSFGFRPFFLFAALWSAAAVPLWIVVLSFNGGMLGDQDGRAWHVHEMLFGFLPGVMAGFLLTAVPNWTGRLPVAGAKLAALVALWTAGRLASFAPPDLTLPAAALDSAFLVVFAAVVWREVLGGRNLRNVPVCLLASGLALANITWHLRGVWPQIGDAPERGALAVAALLIALIGGRIVPSFTLNWMKAERLSPLPSSQDAFDQQVMGLTAAACLAWLVAPVGEATGALLITAGAAGLLRLASWQGWRCQREPLVWILHSGYAWLILGFLMLGVAAMRPGLIPHAAPVHALTAGAIGVMTLAVMTRASLGHTGRARLADRKTLAIYVLVNAAALLRVTAPLVGVWTSALMTLSALLWMGAFGGFALSYGPMLVSRPTGSR